MSTRTKHVALSLVVATILGGPVAFSVSTADERIEVPQVIKNDFAGKVVTAYVGEFKQNPQSAGLVMIDAELMTIGGRVMLVGTGADLKDDKHWTSGLRWYVPWEKVSLCIVMTKEDFEKKRDNRGK